MDRPKIDQTRPTRGPRVPSDTTREVQRAVLSAVKAKARFEQVKLDEKKAKSTPQEKSDLLVNPMQAVRAVAGFYDDLEVVHQQQLEGLQRLELGVTVAETLIRRYGIDLKMLAQMEVKAIARLTSLDAAIAVKDALGHQDVALAMNDCFDNEAYSWGQNKGYSSDEHLTTELAELGEVTGQGVKVARAFYRAEAERGSPSSRLVAQGVDRVLTGLETIEHSGADAIQVAREHYADVDGRLGVAGRTATAAGAILYEVVSAPARAVDEHISNEARGDAIASVALTALLGPAGGSGPRVEIGFLQKGGARMGRALMKPLVPLEGVAKPFAEMARAFEGSAFAARIDRWQDAINPKILSIPSPTLRLGSADEPIAAAADRASLPRDATEPMPSLLDDTIDLQGGSIVDPREVTRPIPRDWAPDPSPQGPPRTGAAGISTEPTIVSSPPTRPTPLTAEAIEVKPIRARTSSPRATKNDRVIPESEGQLPTERPKRPKVPRERRLSTIERTRTPPVDRNVFEVNGPLDPDRPNAILEAIQRARQAPTPMKTDPEGEIMLRALRLKHFKDRA